MEQARKEAMAEAEAKIKTELAKNNINNSFTHSQKSENNNSKTDIGQKAPSP